MRDEEIPWLRALNHLEPTDAADRSSLIRNMLLLRSLAGDDSFGQVQALVEREHARFIAIGEIRAALPQHQSILRADVAQRLDELPPAQAARVREDISRFLVEHPATARALSGENSHPVGRTRKCVGGQGAAETRQPSTNEN